MKRSVDTCRAWHEPATSCSTGEHDNHQAIVVRVGAIGEKQKKISVTSRNSKGSRTDFFFLIVGIFTW